MSTIAQDEYVTRARREISDIDRALVELVNKRLKLVAQLWRYKDEHGLNHVDPAREEWIFDAEPETLWRRVLRSMGGPYSILANTPADPELN